MRTCLRMLCLLATAAVATAAWAADETNVSSGLTIAGAPLALHGYDPVAYFTEGAAMAGTARFTAVHKGAAYRFVSERNRELFQAGPDRYLPSYGGYCAYGVAVGKKFDGDPRVFEIVDGRLYLNLNPDIKATWSKDIPGNIRSADANWRTIEERDADAL